MSQNQKFQHHLDASSDGSKSSSGSEPFLKKHKLVSALILPEHGEASEAPKWLSQPGPELGRISRNQAVKNKIKTASLRESNRKTSNCSQYEPVLLDDLKIFRESIIDELKVAGENMVTSMRKEMKQLAAIASKEDEEEEEPMYFDQLDYSPYSTLPSILPEPRAESHKIDSSRDYAQPGEAGNETGEDLEATKSLIDARTHPRYLPGIQQAKPFGNFSQMEICESFLEGMNS